MTSPRLHIPNLFRAFALSNLFLFSATAFAGVPYSQDACRRISDAAKLTHTQALVIGYEGLFSSSPMNANSLAVYRDKLAHGQKAMRPMFLFGGSFLTRGPLVRIVEAYKNKVEVLVFPRTANEGVHSVPAQCAKIWMAEQGENRKVIIVGHSFGGGAAWELAHSLQTMNVPVAGVVTADPRPASCGGECWYPSWTKPKNVAVWENCYQLSPLRGQVVPGANNHLQGYIGHAAVQNTPCVYNGIANIIKGTKGPLTTDPLKYAGAGQASGSSGDYPQIPSSISGAQNDPKLPDAAANSRRLNRPTSPFFSSLFGGTTGNVPTNRDLVDKNGDYLVRSAAGPSGGASESAVRLPSDGIVHYTKPGGEDLKPKSTVLGASEMGSVAAASGQARGGGAASDSADFRNPATGGHHAASAANGSADATAALGALFSGASSSASAGGPASADSKASGAAIASLMGNGDLPSSSGSLDNDPSLGAIDGASGSASAATEPSSDVSLFERIHSKLKQLAPRS